MSTCKVCETVGLPILFLRHSVVAHRSDFAPAFADKLQAHTASIQALGLPALKYSKYVLRTLRSTKVEGATHLGYLHVFHETLPKGFTSPWELFRIDQGGALIPKGHPAFTSPGPFVCTTKATHPYDTRLYCVPNPREATNIWVAFSANQWNPQQRDANARDAQVMQRINVKQVLANNLPPEAFRADADVFEKHIAEFTLPGFVHGKKPPLWAYVPSLGEAERQVRVMNKKADGRSETERQTKPTPITAGRAFAFVLRDPVGTTSELGDIVMARHMQALDYARSQAQPLGSLQALDFIRKGMSDGHKAWLIQNSAPFTRNGLLKNDPARTPLLGANPKSMPGGQPLPPEADYGEWVQLGVVTNQTFAMSKSNKNYAATARWYQLVDQPDLGLVIAPIDDQAKLRSELYSYKFNRLHREADLELFRKKFLQDTTEWEKSVSNYDSDRAAWLQNVAIASYFRQHFDPKERNDPRQFHKPGLIFMSESLCAAIGAGAPTEGSSAAMCKLIAAQPGQPDGWLVASLLGNQLSVLNVYAEFTLHLGNQLLDENNRMDKTFDALRALLGDEKTGGVLAAKFSWLTPAAAGLHFGLTGVVMAATANALQPLARSASAAVVEAWRNSAPVKLFTAQAAFQITRGAVVDPILTGQPLRPPVVARVELSVRDGLKLFDERDTVQKHYNRRTRDWRAAFEKIPRDKLSGTLLFDFVTTEEDLLAAKKSGDLKMLTKQAESVRVAVMNLKGATLVMLDVDALGALYRRTQRWQGAFAPLRSFAASVAKGAASAGGVAQAMGEAFNAGRKHTPGQLAVLSALLQVRLFLNGRDKLEKLKALSAQTGLTAEQKDAIDAAIRQINLGLFDNVFGVLAGFSEMTAIGAALVRPGTAMGPGLFATAAFAGAAASLMSAGQNFARAAGKFKEGNRSGFASYFAVGLLYAAAAGAGFAFGIEILAAWGTSRVLLQVGLTGGRAAFGAGFARLGLTLPGWGLVVTVLAVSAEGVVSYFDRTKLESWVEGSYFGSNPQWLVLAGPNGRARTGEAEAAPEQKAFLTALAEAHAVSMANNP